MLTLSVSAGDSALLAALLAAALLLLAVSQFVRIPYPILLVLGGVGIGFVPGAPQVTLSPDLVLVAVLPPLLYGSAFFTSLRELRANVRPIGLLAVGLVLTTMLAVATVAHMAIHGLGWAEAFVLGALVSPTDPTAATSIAQRLGLPRRLIALVEGESLVNDGTALVAYRFAVAAVVTGSFSLANATGRFFLNVVGGIAVGLVVGYLIRQLRRRLDNPPVEITIALLSGYFGYLPAQSLGVSGVLAAVTVGIYMGWHTPELTTAQTRLQGQAVWEIVFLLLNGLLFALVGLQLPSILDGLSGRSTTTLLGYAALVSGVVIAARFAWIFPTAFLGRMLSRRVREEDPAPSWSSKTVLAWSGMRGAVSLAAALSLPLATDGGSRFPDRDLIVFLTFGVIFATLVVQGLTLPALIRVLRLEDDESAEQEEAKARIYAAEAGLQRLEELLDEDWVREDTADRLRRQYAFRQERFRSRFDPDGDGSIEDRSQDYQRLRRELLDAERHAVTDLRREGRIDDTVMRKVVRDLDLEDARLEL
ncbi:MAG: monovalent cation/hydrogen antiporter [Gaiellaceae bacterium]|nr:monovalent cation/hydrogen antiporter [Gaiellaceae bacterium]